MVITYLASYPRSGNTLLRIILSQCFGIATTSEYPESWDYLNGLLLEDSDSPYVKTHGLYDPRTMQGRHSYIERDREQVIDSIYCHYAFRISRKAIKQGQIAFGSHEYHVNSWRAANPLWLRFESLLSEETLWRVGDYIGRKQIAGLAAVPSFDELHEIDPAFFREGRGLRDV